MLGKIVGIICSSYVQNVWSIRRILQTSNKKSTRFTCRRSNSILIPRSPQEDPPKGQLFYRVYRNKGGLPYSIFLGVCWYINYKAPSGHTKTDPIASCRDRHICIFTSHHPFTEGQTRAIIKFAAATLGRCLGPRGSAKGKMCHCGIAEVDQQSLV